MENIERLFLSSKLKSNGVMVKSKVEGIFIIMKIRYDFKNRFIKLDAFIITKLLQKL